MYQKILVGTDGSVTARRAVDRAVEVAATLGAALTILTAGPPEKAQAVVEAEASRLGEAGIPIDVKAVNADPASALLEEAERGDYDLLVVGNKGMTGAGRFFLGSVPNKVSHHAPCSLLLVRTT